MGQPRRGGLKATGVSLELGSVLESLAHRAGVCQQHAGSGSVEGVGHVRPVRAEPGSHLAPTASPTLEGRKEGWTEGRRKEKQHGACSHLEKGAWASGELPQEASSAPAGNSNKELRAAFMFGQAGLSPGHSGTRAKAQSGVRSHRWTSQYHLPGGPSNLKMGGRDASASQRRRGREAQRGARTYPGSHNE